MIAPSRVFRTSAWLQAWVDTWGNDPRIKLIDLGGKSKPQDYVYLTDIKLKKIIPAKALCLAGVGYGPLSTPRAEYNDLESLLGYAGSLGALACELKKIPWNHFYLPDVLTQSAHYAHIEALSSQLNALLHVQKYEPAYSVGAIDFKAYTAQLSASTRLVYFNRRERLSKYGEIEIESYPLNKAKIFFEHLNQFHLARWGVECYSGESQRFLVNFMERLQEESGEALLEVMRVNGEIVSVLFDVIYCGRRYNFQSGYQENKFSKIALGAIHMGFAIESALGSGLVYDFMAGQGKNSNYKSRISTTEEVIGSLRMERSYIKAIRYIQSKL